MTGSHFTCFSCKKVQILKRMWRGAVEGGEGGTRLLALHTEASLGLQVIAERESACPFCPYSTPIVVGIFGTGISATQVSDRQLLVYQSFSY